MRQKLIGAARTTLKGSELEGLKFQHPFLDALQVPAVLAGYVTLEAGTGIVHTAPGHGAAGAGELQRTRHGGESARLLRPARRFAGG